MRGSDKIENQLREAEQIIAAFILQFGKRGDSDRYYDCGLSVFQHAFDFMGWGFLGPTEKQLDEALGY